MATHPGVVTIAGSPYKCAAILKRGSVETARGGFKQALMLDFHLPYSSIPAATLIDATTGQTKRLTVTFKGTDYRLTDDGVHFDPHQTRWILHATEAVQ